jgi:hypothetical protein
VEVCETAASHAADAARSHLAHYTAAAASAETEHEGVIADFLQARFVSCFSLAGMTD